MTYKIKAKTIKENKRQAVKVGGNRTGGGGAADEVGVERGRGMGGCDQHPLYTCMELAKNECDYLKMEAS